MISQPEKCDLNFGLLISPELFFPVTYFSAIDVDESHTAATYNSMYSLFLAITLSPRIAIGKNGSFTFFPLFVPKIHTRTSRLSTEKRILR